MVVDGYSCFAFAAFGLGDRSPLRLDPLQQRLCTVLPADQLRVIPAPLLGELSPKGLGQNGLGEVVDAGQGVVDLLFDAVGVGEELVYSADDFGLLLSRWEGNYELLKIHW